MRTAPALLLALALGAPAAAATLADVVRATLTFNVDDVISTFGSNTDFNGMAAERILLQMSGEGTMEAARA